MYEFRCFFGDCDIHVASRDSGAIAALKESHVEYHLRHGPNICDRCGAQHGKGKPAEDCIRFLQAVNKDIWDRNDTLRNELRKALENNHQRNIELDALYYVWCDGGCENGVRRYQQAELSAEIVEAAERNMIRLRKWWEARKSRKADMK